jgi:uncharacterized membrane protein YcaP (DUF421 family)
VLIADAAQNAMAGGYQTVTEGIILVSTIAGWNWLLDMVAYRFQSVRRLIEARPLPLVRDGKLMRRNLRHEMITVDELMAKLRERGVEGLDQVKSVTMESDGEISVIKHKETGESTSPPDSAADKVSGWSPAAISRRHFLLYHGLRGERGRPPPAREDGHEP